MNEATFEWKTAVATKVQVEGAAERWCEKHPNGIVPFHDRLEMIKEWPCVSTLDTTWADATSVTLYPIAKKTRCESLFGMVPGKPGCAPIMSTKTAAYLRFA